MENNKPNPRIRNFKKWSHSMEGSGMYQNTLENLQNPPILNNLAMNK